MEHLFILAVATTVVFCIFKIIEQKYLEKEMKPMKYLVRDALFVFFATLGSSYSIFYMRSTIGDFFNVVMDNKAIALDNTQIFTDAPGF